jgi:drug/metabolite transporter (DMT)-like permease
VIVPHHVQLAGVAILGYVISGEFPDGWTWFGAVIIISSGIYNFYLERRLERG